MASGASKEQDILNNSFRVTLTFVLQEFKEVAVGLYLWTYRTSHEDLPTLRMEVGFPEDRI